MTTGAVPTLEPILLIDDLRVFLQPVDATIVRTSAAGLGVLREADSRGHSWSQIWLDHDLGEATGTVDVIGPVVDFLCRRAAEGRPVDVDEILVHTSNSVGGDTMVRTLARSGYRVLRLAAGPYLRVDWSLFVS